ncbi:hypothetical protein KY289_032815 [Solanum tuberosum]|nr:hypothetical protein KY289_032815 [Solanum tuberosum]
MTKDPTLFPSSPFHPHCFTDQSAYPTSDSSFHPTIQCDHETLSDTNPTLPPDPSSPPHHPSHSNTSTTPLQQVHHPDITTRKSHRTHKLPTYLSDYVHSIPVSQPTDNHTSTPTTPTTLTAYFSLNHHISPAELDPNSQVFALNIAHDCEPSSYEEAALDPAW